MLSSKISPIDYNMATKTIPSIFLLLMTLLLLNYELITAYGKSPILIVPGFVSSQLEARVKGHGLCNTFFGLYEHYWINILRFPVTCVNSALSLDYDSATGIYSNPKGVDVRVPYFGGTKGVETMDRFPYLIRFFRGFVDYFVKKGYVRGRTIRSAPYDWRMAADDHERSGYYNNVKDLVEEMYEDAGNEKVTLAVHSMGGPVTLYFLNNIVSQEWKNKYIHAFVSLAGGWSGTHTSIAILLSAGGTVNNFLSDLPLFGSFWTKLAPLRAFQSLKSPVWLLPSPSVTNDLVLAEANGRKYTANDYKELFTDAGAFELYEKYEHVRELNEEFPPPNVPTYCYIAIGSPTPESFTYSPHFNLLLKVNFGDGDGVVNRVSAEVCKRWSNQEAFFTSKEYPGVGHLDMLSDERILNDIADVVGV